LVFIPYVEKMHGTKSLKHFFFFPGHSAQATHKLEFSERFSSSSWITISDSINVYYIPTYAQISGVNLYGITPTCFGVHTPSSGSLQVALWIIKTIKCNILVCRYEKKSDKCGCVCNSWLGVCVVRSKQEPDHTHTRKHAPNHELHMRPHLPRFCHNNTLLYYILLF